MKPLSSDCRPGPALYNENMTPVAKVRTDGVISGLLRLHRWCGRRRRTYRRGRSGNAYVTGWTVSIETSFPVTVGPDLISNGAGDAFVAKITTQDLPWPIFLPAILEGQKRIGGNPANGVISLALPDGSRPSSRRPPIFLIYAFGSPRIACGCALTAHRSPHMVQTCSSWGRTRRGRHGPCPGPGPGRAWPASRAPRARLMALSQSMAPGIPLAMSAAWAAMRAATMPSFMSSARRAGAGARPGSRSRGSPRRSRGQRAADGRGDGRSPGPRR